MKMAAKYVKPLYYDTRNFALTKEDFIARHARRRLRCKWQNMIVCRDELDRHIAEHGPFSPTPPAPGDEPWADLGFAMLDPDDDYDFERTAEECDRLKAEIAASEPIRLIDYE